MHEISRYPLEVKHNATELAEEIHRIDLEIKSLRRDCKRISGLLENRPSTHR